VATSDNLGAVPGDLIGGRYRVVGELGRGGMGVVYEAVQEPLGRRVALKLLRRELAEDASFVARFRREAELAASLGHPNIAQVTDFGVDEGRPFLVMDLLRGESLAQLLVREGRLDETRAAFIAAQMLDALAVAHARGVVHRDLKPDNVFLSQISGVCDVVRLLDFGIAHSGGDEAMRMTRTGQVLGTPAYMSPEQARGRPVDEASDLYAVGVCLYESTSGRLPFDTGNYHELLFSIVGEEPPELCELRPELSAEFCAVVKCAMAKDAAARFEDATSMREALLSLAQVEPMTPRASRAEASVADGAHAPAVTPATDPPKQRTPAAFAPTVTPATDPPKQRTPAAFAPTVTPATEPPPPASAPTSNDGGRPRRWLWLLPGLAIAALAVMVGRVTNEPASESAPPTEGIQASVDVPRSSAPPAALVDAAVVQADPVDAGLVIAPTSDAGPAPAAADDPPSSAAPPTMESRASKSAPRARATRQARTRMVDCNGTLRELPIVRRSDVAEAQSFMGNHVVELTELKRQARAHLDEVAACYRGHAMRQGRWWQLTLDAEGVVRDVQARGYCDLDAPARACMSRLWTGYRFEGFTGEPGWVRIGFSLRGR